MEVGHFVLWPNPQKAVWHFWYLSIQFKTVLKETLKLGFNISLSVLAIPLQIHALRYSVYCVFYKNLINT